MPGVTISREKENGGWGRYAHARPGQAAIAILGGGHVFGFESPRIGPVPVVVFEHEALEATQGGTPIETIDDGGLSAFCLFPGTSVEIHLRNGYQPGRNGVKFLVVQASIESEY